jgi:fluoride exporter
MTAIVIAAAAALGALSRYAVESVLPNGRDGTHYIGTLTVNLTGALAIGIVSGALTPRFSEHPQLRNLLVVGFLSSYTTFSALSSQTIQLGQRDSTVIAAIYALGTLGAGIMLAYVGLVLGRAL